MMGGEQQSFWQSEAERGGIPYLTKIISELHEGQQQILRILEENDNKHIETRRDIDTLKKAFPALDLDGHRRYHQTLIDSLEERRKLRKAIQEKTISGLIWAGIVWISSQIWTHLPKLWESRL